MIAPHSFAALLLLPKEQLQEVVEKQPTMRAPLREYVKQSEWGLTSLPISPFADLVLFDLIPETGSNKARCSALLESLGGDDDGEGTTPTAVDGGGDLAAEGNSTPRE